MIALLLLLVIFVLWGLAREQERTADNLGQIADTLRTEEEYKPEPSEYPEYGVVIIRRRCDNGDPLFGIPLPNDCWVHRQIGGDFGCRVPDFLTRKDAEDFIESNSEELARQWMNAIDPWGQYGLSQR